MLQTQQEIYGDGKNMTQLSKAELAMRSEDLSLMTGWRSKAGGKPHRGGRVSEHGLCLSYNHKLLLSMNCISLNVSAYKEKLSTKERCNHTLLIRTRNNMEL